MKNCYKLIREFNKEARYKNNIQKSIASQAISISQLY